MVACRFSKGDGKVENVYFVVKGSGSSRGQFAVAEFGGRIPPGFSEVSRPRTRTLQKSKALRRAKELQDQAAARTGGRHRKVGL
jgi:hypothetical protein